MNWLERVNHFIAVKVTYIFGSMWTFYLLFFGLPFLYHVNPVLTNFLSSNWLQSWSLPAIAVGSIVLYGDANETSKRNHKEAMERLDQIEQRIFEIIQNQNEINRMVINLQYKR